MPPPKIPHVGTIANLVGAFAETTQTPLLVDQQTLLPSSSLSPSGPAGGDLGGTYPNPQVVGLQGNAVSNTAPMVNYVLTWNGSSWTPLPVPLDGIQALSSPDGTLLITNGLGPSTTAEIAQQGATLNQVLGWNGASWVPMTATDVDTLAGDVTGPIGSNTISSLQGNTVSATSPTTGQVLEFNGAQWVPFTLPTGVGQAATTVGDGVNQTFNFAHNLASTDIQVQVFELVPTRRPVLMDTPIVDPNHIDVNFSFVPDPNTYRVIVTV